MYNNLPADVLRYLNKYQVKGWNIEPDLYYRFKNIIIIPALAEYQNIRNLLASLQQNRPDYLKQTLILFVINNIRSVKHEVKEENLLTLKMLLKLINKEKTSDQFLLDIIKSELTLAIVDASSEGKELSDREGGVGFARKLGMDLALTVFNYKDPRKNILICLDADCSVEPNYLETIIKAFNEQNLSAACVKFRHLIEGPEKQKLAIICYEIFLRYYVLGLKYAQSLYSFHTVGSSMVCDHNAYVKSEGMNKLKAAEDFYFLEKLAKNYPINVINNTTVYPSPRSSWRVPFGTGQRVSRFLSKKQNEYLLYDPLSFEILKSWLELFNSAVILQPEDYLNEAHKIHPGLKNFLELQNFRKSWDKIIRYNKNPVQINRQKSLWFDGFRTLKLIHHLRDSAFPLINMFKALDSMLDKFNITPGFRKGAESIPPLEIQENYLELLRSLD